MGALIRNPREYRVGIDILYWSTYTDSFFACPLNIQSNIVVILSTLTLT